MKNFEGYIIHNLNNYYCISIDKKVSIIEHDPIRNTFETKVYNIENAEEFKNYIICQIKTCADSLRFRHYTTDHSKYLEFLATLYSILYSEELRRTK
jgi:hypothetical protein